MNDIANDIAAANIRRNPRLADPLVMQELHEFYVGPLRDALRESGLSYSYGDAGTGADVDEMVFDQRAHRALVEVIGDSASETGRVIGHGAGAEIVFNAVLGFTAEFGTPATFVAELHPEPGPVVRRQNGPAVILR